jgi:hypothetical protein
MLRYLEEAVANLGPQIAPGTNRTILSNGISVELILGQSDKVVLFYPVKQVGHGVIDVSELLSKF